MARLFGAPEEADVLSLSIHRAAEIAGNSR